MSGSPFWTFDCNEEADKLAKRGVEDYRVPFMVRQEWKRRLDETKDRARWIGRANAQANNLPRLARSQIPALAIRILVAPKPVAEGGAEAEDYLVRGPII